MHRDEFDYSLPRDLIAQYPVANRGDSRLLYLDSNNGKYEDLGFKSLPEILGSGDLLIFNDTRVMPARLYGKKETGGQIEILIERILDNNQALAQIRASKTPKAGTRILLDAGLGLEVIDREEDMFVVKFNTEQNITDILDSIGHMPLPPYIERPDETIDRERYQTIYAKNPGAVAAPTAGLHFTDTLLNTICAKGVELANITLHVGAGTFQPVRSEQIEDHRMHKEYMEITDDVCHKVNYTKAQGGKIVAVGTTSLRGLETAASSGQLKPYKGETDLFIYPGYQFNLVDILITNFHLPESTLLMLVCAFGGKDYVMQAYQHAIEKKYRFYSYGDAMFIKRYHQEV